MPHFEDIHGQDDAIDRLRRTLRGSRQPHAFIFAGPEGVGREMTATAMAQALLCEQPPAPDDPCGRCPSCRMMQAGSHPDFQLVYKELAAYHEDAAIRSRVMQELGIEVIRSFLIAPSAQGAARGRGKVFIVRQAELMSNAAQNALLKTLEEPPPGVRIILLTQRLEQMLPTTRSRCWILRFAPLDIAFVTEQLIARDVEPAEARFLSALTGGSIGVGLRLAGSDLLETKRNVLTQLVSLPQAAGGDLGEDLAKITDSLANQAVAESGKDGGPSLSKNLASRQAAGMLLKLLATVYTDAMHLACGQQHVALVHADQPEIIERIAERFSPSQLATIVEQLSRYEQLLWRNVNPKLVWDNVTISCSSGRQLAI